MVLYFPAKLREERVEIFPYSGMVVTEEKAIQREVFIPQHLFGLKIQNSSSPEKCRCFWSTGSMTIKCTIQTRTLFRVKQGNMNNATSITSINWEYQGKPGITFITHHQMSALPTKISSSLKGLHPKEGSMANTENKWPLLSTRINGS